MALAPTKMSTLGKKVLHMLCKSIYITLLSEKALMLYVLHLDSLHLVLLLL